MSEETHGEISADPLGSALQALKGQDPTIKRARQELWKRVWARDNVVDWIRACDERPVVCKFLHRALPDGDIDLLEEIKSVAERCSNSNTAFFIVGLVNDRLDRCRFRLADEEQRCYAEPSDVQNALRRIRSNGFVSGKLNYAGYLCAAVSVEVDGLYNNLSFPHNEVVLPTKSQCLLSAWVDANKEEGIFAESLLIETGVESDIVSFGFELDCATLRMPYGRKTIRVHRKLKSDSVEFPFSTPARAGTHAIYIHAFQGPDLVNSVMIIVKVGSPQRHGNFSRKNKRKS